MTFDLSQIQTRRSTGPVHGVVYGPPGVGKTAFAAEWPAPVFMFLEDGAGLLDVQGSDVLSDYSEVDGMLSALYEGEHNFETLVIDTVDHLEPLVWAEACKRNNWKSIEEPGYGRGYVEADAVWREFLRAIAMIRADREMNILMLAHAEVRHFEDPLRASYDRYQIRLHKRACGIIEDNAEFIGFLDNVVVTAEDKTSATGKRAKAKAPQEKLRAMQWGATGAAIAKNRFHMPPSMQLQQGSYFTAIAPYFPRYAAPDAAVSEAA